MKKVETKCENAECPLSFSCWRFNAPPADHEQYYAMFEPIIDKALEEIECKMYIQKPNEEKSVLERLLVESITF